MRLGWRLARVCRLVTTRSVEEKVVGARKISIEALSGEAEQSKGADSVGLTDLGRVSRFLRGCFAHGDVRIARWPWDEDCTSNGSLCVCPSVCLSQDLDSSSLERLTSRRTSRAGDLVQPLDDENEAVTEARTVPCSVALYDLSPIGSRH